MRISVFRVGLSAWSVMLRCFEICGVTILYFGKIRKCLLGMITWNDFHIVYERSVGIRVDKKFGLLLVDAMRRLKYMGFSLMKPLSMWMHLYVAQRTKRTFQNRERILRTGARVAEKRWKTLIVSSLSKSRSYLRKASFANSGDGAEKHHWNTSTKWNIPWWIGSA